MGTANNFFYPALRMLLLVIVCALPLGACDSNPVRSVVDKLPILSKTDSKAGSTRTTSTTDAVDTAQLFRTRPANMRSSHNLSRLFAQGTVNGRDLIAELKAIKQTANAASTQRAMTSLLGAIDVSIARKNADSFDWKNIGDNLVLSFLDELRSSISYDMLDYFFDVMLTDKDALERETVKLPSAKGLNAAQQQRILNMAAMVIGARVADRIAEEAEETYKNLDDEYARLLQRRVEIAGLLAEVVDQRRKAVAARDELAARRMTQELSRYLSQEDIAFIDNFGPDRPLSDFANDFGMQNLALQFLRRKNPQAYAEYRSQTDGLVGRTKAYVKTVGGATAFGGLLAGFSHDVMAVLKDSRNSKSIWSMLPLGYDFVSAMAPLAVRNLRTWGDGIAVASADEDLFEVMSGPGDAKRFDDADEVFAELKTAGEIPRLQDALFSGNTRGLLYRVYACDADTTGRLMDKAVPEAMRNEFGEKFMSLPEGTDFYFLNALTSDNFPRQRQLVNEVLNRDQRQRATVPVVGDVQQQIAGNMTTWNKSQLARLILSNHYGPMTHAQMQVGSVIVRLVPSMEAIYAYESYSDSCRARLN